MESCDTPGPVAHVMLIIGQVPYTNTNYIQLPIPLFAKFWLMAVDQANCQVYPDCSQ